MGDKFVITDIEVIQDGLFQIDIKNENTNKSNRLFVEPSQLFSMIGAAMQKNFNKYCEDRTEEYMNNFIES
jgi:hypothetical protein